MWRYFTLLRLSSLFKRIHSVNYQIKTYSNKGYIYFYSQIFVSVILTRTVVCTVWTHLLTQYGHWDGRCTFRSVQPFCSTAMLRIVMHEHVVGNSHQRTVDCHLIGDDDLCILGVNRYFEWNVRYQIVLGNYHLEASHVAWIASIFQTVLVAFQEKFQKESAKRWEIQRLIRIGVRSRFPFRRKYQCCVEIRRCSYDKLCRNAACAIRIRTHMLTYYRPPKKRVYVCTWCLYYQWASSYATINTE